MRDWAITSLLYNGEPVFVHQSTGELAVESHGEHLVPIPLCPGPPSRPPQTAACDQGVHTLTASAIRDLLRDGVEPHDIDGSLILAYAKVQGY